MSEPPPGQPMPSPEPGEVPPPRRRALAVLGGIVVGLVLGFLVIPILLGSAGGSLGDGDLAGFAFVATLAGPLLLGLGLLAVPSLRRVAAGLVLGISLGLIVGSVSCLGLVGIFFASYNGGG